MMVKIEIEFNPVGVSDQPVLHFIAAIAALGKGFAGEQRGFMTEAVPMVAQPINAGVHHELARGKIPGFTFGKALRAHCGGRHKLPIISRDDDSLRLRYCVRVFALRRNISVTKMMLEIQISDG